MRAIDGHGAPMARSPDASSPATAGISAPVVPSSNTGTTPATGVCAAPGLWGASPEARDGAIMMAPVSVCQ